jgi:hypothetical protein
MRAGESRAPTLARVRREAGFTYLFVLFMVALLGVGLAAAGEAWESQRLRSAEGELLWTGDQYRRALGAYYRNLAGCGAERNRYPRQLADLVKDPRCPATVRYLRKLYPDPVTGGDWVLVRSPDGGIAGVHSRSDRRPFKVTGFRVEDRDFENKQTYRDWVFLDNTLAAARVPQPPPGSAQALPGVLQPSSGGSPQSAAPGSAIQPLSLGGMSPSASPAGAPGTFMSTIPDPGAESSTR